MQTIENLPMSGEECQELLAEVSEQATRLEAKLAEGVVEYEMARIKGNKGELERIAKTVNTVQAQLTPLRERRRLLNERLEYLAKQEQLRFKLQRKEAWEQLKPTISEVRARAEDANVAVEEAARLLIQATTTWLKAKTEVESLGGAIRRNCAEFNENTEEYRLPSMSWSNLYIGQARIADIMRDMGSRVPGHKHTPFSGFSRLVSLAESPRKK